jgi:hypothetical protein
MITLDGASIGHDDAGTAITIRGGLIAAVGGDIDGDSRLSPGRGDGGGGSVPAEVRGLRDRGHLSARARADLTLFDPSMRVDATMAAGEVVRQS